MSRPIGPTVRAVCELAEQIGPCTARQIKAQITVPLDGGAARQCRRAVDHGLMVADTSSKPLVYRVVEGWRDLLKPEKQPIEPPRVVHHLQGVWP